MPRVSDIALLRKNDQPTIFIRTRTKVENLPALIGTGYGRMAAYLKELGEELADIPYVAYYNMDMQDLDVEIGFPVADVCPGKDDIQSGFIPGGKQVFCMYRGPYGDMAPVYQEMAEWITQNGFSPVGTSYEFYYNGPGFPEDEMLTKIVMPVS